MASPLTLLMPVLPGKIQELAQTVGKYQAQLDAALQSIGTVHYARTLILDASVANLQPGSSPNPSDSFVLAIITEYDGSFADYIGDFVAQVGTVFDAALPFVVGGAAVVPVANNVAAFQAFVTANDASQHAPNTSLFQSYTYTVQQILASGIPDSASTGSTPSTGPTGSSSSPASSNSTSSSPASSGSTSSSSSSTSSSSSSQSSHHHHHGKH
jgi:hypothetical protein